jgi:hypothetical protein
MKYMAGKFYNQGERYGGYFTDMQTSEYTIPSGFTATNKSLIRVNGVVTLGGSIKISAGSITTGTTIATLPERYRPDREIVGIPACLRNAAGSTTPIFVKVTKTGAIVVETVSVTEYIQVDINFSFIA